MLGVKAEPVVVRNREDMYRKTNVRMYLRLLLFYIFVIFVSGISH